MMGLPQRIRAWVLNLFSTNVRNVTFQSFIETSRYVMTSGHRKRLSPLPEPYEIQIPGAVLFIPYELVKLYGTAEIEYTGFFTDSRAIDGEPLPYERRFKMDARYVQVCNILQLSRTF